MRIFFSENVILLAGEAMVWLSSLVVLQSVALSYVQENKLLFMGHKIGERENYLLLFYSGP